MELTVKSISGSDTSKKVKLDKNIFAIEPNNHAIYLDVKNYLANQRQGTHKTKERSELSGSTRKLKKQKGTGSARFGDIKNPIFRGGARVFGPKPRKYGFKINKKLKDLARKSALTYKAKDKAISVVEDFNFDTPKTKQFIELLRNLQVLDKKSLVVIGESNKNVYLSSRNFKGSKVITASEINTYDILNASSLVMSESTIGKIEEILK